MKTIKLLILLSIFSYTSFSQIENYSKKEIDEYERNGWKYSEIDQCFIKHETFDTIYSNDKQNKIILRHAEVGDANVKTTMYLHDSKAKTHNLGSCLSHDWQCYFVFFTEDNKYLIFQETRSVIKVMDLNTNSIVYELNGFHCSAEKGYDKPNHSFFYYNFENIKKPVLSVFYINTLSIKELHRFECRFGMEKPTINFESDTRKLTIIVYDEDCNDFKIEEIIVEY